MKSAKHLAQVAANNSGIRLLHQLVNENGLKKVEAYMHFIQHNAEQAVRNMLKEFASKHGTRAHAIDYMDDGTAIELTIDIDPKDEGYDIKKEVFMIGSEKS